MATYTADNNINRMMSQVKRSNLFSRPYLYYVTITPPNKLRGDYSKQLKEIALNCDTVSIPGAVIATKPTPQMGAFSTAEYAYDKIVEPITLTFYVSDDVQEFNFIRAWMDLMIVNTRVSYYTDYIGTITIHQCSGVAEPDGEDLKVMLSATLLEAYPKTVTPLALGHGLQGAIQKVSTNITYRDIKYTDHTGLVPENSFLNTFNDFQRHIDEAMAIASETGSTMGHFLDSLSLPKLSTIVRGKNMIGGISI